MRDNSHLCPGLHNSLQVVNRDDRVKEGKCRVTEDRSKARCAGGGLRNISLALETSISKSLRFLGSFTEI